MDSAAVIGAVIGQGVDLLLLVAGVLGALAFMLWKVIIPGARWITTINEKVVPNFQYMPLLAELQPVLRVMQDIAAQFAPDSGETLKDATDRLETHAKQNQQAVVEARLAADDAKLSASAAMTAATEWARTNAAGIKALEIMVGTLGEHAKDDRDLARGDRDLARDALMQIRDLVAAADRTEKSGARVEASGARVEADRAHVAEDLAESQRRADDVEAHEPPGTAADAASQSPEDPDGSR